MKTGLSQVGHRARKVDAVKLVTGRGTYTDDVVMPGLLHAKLVKSPHPHARVLCVDKTEAQRLPGVHAIITHEDVPRIPYTSAGQSWPEPSPYDMYILDRKVRFVGDPVAAVAAETPAIATRAAELVKVEYEVLPAILDMHDAMKPGASVIHDEEESYGIYDPSRNIAAHIDTEIGDVEKGFERADLIVENEFFVQYQQHTCLEPHVSICFFDEDRRLVVRTSTQIPYHCRRMLAFALDIPIRNVHIIKPRVGGGFGNKQEMVTEPIAAVLAIRTGRPVKLEYTRAEEFTIARNRHPQHSRLKTGVRRDGSITANALHVLTNTGPYGTHALTVTGNTGTKPLPLYRSPNMKFYADIVYTNLPIAAAFRGYGAPQGFFAMEVHMDEVAEALGMDPLEFRRLNHIRQGDTDLMSAAAGEGSGKKPRVIHSSGLPQCLTRGAEAVGMDPLEFRRRNHIRVGDTDLMSAAAGEGSGKKARVMHSVGLPECLDRGAEAIGWSEKRGKPGTGTRRRG
ncbi:MAG: molybdopterin-dependent oxidoreductase, partial [Chloroflexi bacterium]|nr:molybdopterin-dependent oxidoreductase [Chloroflexota bacterium]